MPHIYECRLVNNVFKNDSGRWTTAKQVAIQGFNDGTCEHYDVGTPAGAPYLRPASFFPASLMATPKATAAPRPVRHQQTAARRPCEQSQDLQRSTNPAGTVSARFGTRTPTCRQDRERQRAAAHGQRRRPVRPRRVKAGTITTTLPRFESTGGGLRPGRQFAELTASPGRPR